MFDASDLIRELQEMRDEGHLSDALMRRSVKRIEESDDRFDWVGVYMLNEKEHELWLHNYVGTPTEQAKIPVGEGVCGTAVAEKTNQNVAHLTALENYVAGGRDIQAELVVLIRAGDEIFGEIDIDSDQPAAFGDDDVQAVEAVADKLAEQLAAERR